MYKDDLAAAQARADAAELRADEFRRRLEAGKCATCSVPAWKRILSRKCSCGHSIFVCVKAVLIYAACATGGIIAALAYG